MLWTCWTHLPLSMPMRCLLPSVTTVFADQLCWWLRVAPNNPSTSGTLGKYHPFGYKLFNLLVMRWGNPATLSLFSLPKWFMVCSRYVWSTGYCEYKQHWGNSADFLVIWLDVLAVIWFSNSVMFRVGPCSFQFFTSFGVPCTSHDCKCQVRSLVRTFAF